MTVGNLSTAGWLSETNDRLTSAVNHFVHGDSDQSTYAKYPTLANVVSDYNNDPASFITLLVSKMTESLRGEFQDIKITPEVHNVKGGQFDVEVMVSADNSTIKFGISVIENKYRLF